MSTSLPGLLPTVHFPGIQSPLLPTLLSCPGIKGNTIQTLKSSCSGAMLHHVRSLIDADCAGSKDPFYVLDLGAVARQVNNWRRLLPHIRPFYAVKCNPNPALLGALAALGISFDCASRNEIETILTLGVDPGRIIYANPCKPDSHIRFAAEVGVKLTTFDSVCELEKMVKLHPKCDLLLRLKAPDDSGARRPLGLKYGALPLEVEPLLRAAKEAKLSVVGVSFHVGSGATNFDTYRTAIASAREAFATANKLGGQRMRVLNIGGGFTAGLQFTEAAAAIDSAISAHFSDYPDLDIISEPGRIFAETSMVLAVNIIGKRRRGERREYWINDGIHGSMSCIKNDTANVNLAPLARRRRKMYVSAVFGPTCDAMDVVAKEGWLPEMEVGDWLVAANMGAYTACMGSDFNGFRTSDIRVHLAYSDPF